MPIGSIISGIIGSNSAKKAAQQQTQQYEKGLQYLKDTNAQQRSDQYNYMVGGGQGLAAYLDALGHNGTEGTTRALNQFQTGPGYQSALSAGVSALDRSAASRGRLNSGRQGMDLERFGQDLANQRWDSYLNQQFSLANLGQNAAAGTGANAVNLAGQVNQGYGNIGDAQAAGTIGSANSLIGGINSLGSSLGGMSGQGGGGASGILKFFGLG
jgi:hypothetical protein